MDDAGEDARISRTHALEGGQDVAELTHGTLEPPILRGVRMRTERIYGIDDQLNWCHSYDANSGGGHARRDRGRRERGLLRPVQGRDHARSLSDVPAPARRGTALLQRAVRLLRHEPLRRRPGGSLRSRDL